ncbi:2-methylaconitate cis-trans isomerase PrpF family protein [Rhodococcus sp. ACPA1]|uniref:2-methylaconitate cis-trans isomerase PrpF family protein n=1 Tax=Rhodococcus sp. ACPA1 TaxID=2028572 RepID=UPI000BB11EDD|nr:PrpF domain-containing protein [Rhodococcus sp. ACPA1]PBC51542.1 PrpF family protein [Rhodococcus sp. ACPA1]
MRRYPAVFMRGGTSKALVFHAADLPEDRSQWDRLFLAAMGSPDPSGRQLDGMGGGISSLSKVCVVGPPTHPDADVDYTFAQVQVTSAAVDYGGNCGNMSSAVGPFAVDEGLVSPKDGEVVVRIHNTNTGKIIHSTFWVRDGQAVTEGGYSIDGVAGTGSPIRLDFLDLGGAATGLLLPTGNVVDTLSVADAPSVIVSMVDAANPCVFVEAGALGLDGTELPEHIESLPEHLQRLESIRQAASVAMGVAPTTDAAALNRLVPFVAVVARSAPYSTLSGRRVAVDDTDLLVRFLSSGQPHRAVPVTGAMCSAIASRVPGTVVHAALGGPDHPTIRLGTPSGVLEVNASVTTDGPAPQLYRADFASTYRTARRLFEGRVLA